MGREKLCFSPTPFGDKIKNDTKAVFYFFIWSTVSVFFEFNEKGLGIGEVFR